MFIHEQRREIGYKIVYYGPAMGGKTTNVRYIAETAARRMSERASELITLETRGSRTLYFDMVRLSFGSIGTYKTYFNLYTTPGQNVYITSRRLVLQGADAIVFVMDSQQSRLRDNVQSWYTLERQLLELNVDRHRIPLVLQFNKRDMPYVASPQQLRQSINGEKFPAYEANAQQGIGVFPTLRWVLEALMARTEERFKQGRYPERLDHPFETVNQEGRIAL
jgi:signal recognition particle receptor subunit beta